MPAAILARLECDHCALKATVAVSRFGLGEIVNALLKTGHRVAWVVEADEDEDADDLPSSPLTGA